MGVSLDWRVRVFGTSSLVDRPSERLVVCMYVLLIYMGAWIDDPFTSPFITNCDWPATAKPAL